MENNKYERHNGIVEEIGFYICRQYNQSSIRVQFKNSGGTCVFYLSNKQFMSFVDIFKEFYSLNDVDVENGFYIEKLKGLPLCGWFEKGRIVAFSSFMDDNGNDMVEI